MANKKQLTPRANRMEPNIVIDGGMEIWPAGTSVAVANNLQLYGSVLFRCANVSSGVTMTTSQQASVPSGTNIPFSNQVSKTAAGTLAAGTNVNLSHLIEGYDINKLLVDEFSLIFWVKSSVASNRSVALLNNAQSHSLIQQYNIASANVWQLQVLKYSGLNTCPGVIEKTTNTGAQFAFTTVAGTTFQTATLNSWVAGNFRSGVGEDTTWLTGTTHDFSIAGVMVLPGDWRSLTSNTSVYRFQRSGKNYSEEVQKTLRYYQTSSHSAPVPGNASGVLGGLGRVMFPVEMRVAPTFVATGNGTANQARNDNNGATEGALVYGIGNTNVTVRSTSALTASTHYSFQWTADARF